MKHDGWTERREEHSLCLRCGCGALVAEDLEVMDESELTAFVAHLIHRIEVLEART